MGCSSSSTRGDRPRPHPIINGVRVVHINGYVEEFVDEAVVTVSDVTGKPPKMMLCSLTRLSSVGFQPLRLEDHLENGTLYFLLPLSVFNSDASLMEHVALANRLSAVAFDPATPIDKHVVGVNSSTDEKTMSGIVYGGGEFKRRTSSCKIQPWKPALDSIEERSVGKSNRGDQTNTIVSTTYADESMNPNGTEV